MPQLRAKALAKWNAVGRYRRRQRSLENAYRAAVLFGNRQRERCLSELVRATQAVVRRHKSLVNAKLVRRLRRYFERAFAAGSKSQRAHELLGCTVDQLRQHLERQFKPGMTWANHSFEGWHIDHRRPLASFDLSDPAQQLAAFHFSNLQPLWAEENFEKRDRV